MFFYSGLLPSNAAIRQACHEPLDAAPKGHQAFAIYILQRAHQIDAVRAVAEFANRAAKPGAAKNGSDVTVCDIKTAARQRSRLR